MNERRLSARRTLAPCFRSTGFITLLRRQLTSPKIFVIFPSPLKLTRGNYVI